MNWKLKKFFLNRLTWLLELWMLPRDLFRDKDKDLERYRFKPLRPPSVLEWINSHPKIAGSIKWQFKFEQDAYDVPETAKKAWKNWSPAEQQELRNAFNEAWYWYYSQSNPVKNLQEYIAYPPINFSQTYNDDSASPMVKVDETYAWKMYTRWIALNMVAELGNHFPWSLLNYDSTSLQVLFDSAAIMSRDPNGKYAVGSPTPWHSNYVKRKDNLGSSLIAPPRYTYAFLAKNRLIASTRKDTIAKVLQWCSDNMAHFYDSSTYKNMEAHWQYRGIPPISRIVQGTVYSGNNQFGHWTAGCHGTGGFLRNVLRAANIPVHLVRVCDHQVVHFMTEDLYLDHGDNPYNSKFKSTGLPAAALLIDDKTYKSRFGTSPDNHDSNCQYVGYQVDLLAKK